MDVLIRKVKKTPGSPKPDSGAVRHEKLGEGWAENKQPVAEDSGVVFYLKYLGFTLVDEVVDDESYGDGASTKAVQRIVAMAKSEGKKLKKVSLTVSSKGIHMVDITTKEVLADLSIYRISFCTADRNHDKVFAFIARSTINETMECHAFLCAKTKIAQAVTLTVWQAFNVAQDKWTDQQQRKLQRAKDRCKAQAMVVVAPQDNTPLIDLQPPHQQSQNPAQSTVPASLFTSPFLDSFADYSMSALSTGNGVHTNHTQPSTDLDDDLEDSFSKLAETRGRVRVPSFSTDLRQEDVDDSVQQYMDGRRCFEEFSRQRSIEDLLSL